MKPSADDSGITLVELIVYIAITALFLGLLASLFISGIQAQAQATDRDTATGRSGVVSNTLLTSVRNSTAFTVTGGNQVLVAKVSTAAGGYVCRAWAVMPGGDLRYRESPSAIATADTSTWTVLVPGSAAGDGAAGSLKTRTGTNPDMTPIYSGLDANGDGRTDTFSRTGQNLSIGLDITLGDTTVAVTNGVTAQAANDGTDTTTCW